MSYALVDRWLSRSATALLFVAVAVLAIWRLDDPDTWWHLAAGRYIVSTHTVPSLDVFSYTATQRPWIDLQWLFQVAAYAVQSVGGVSALILMTAALAVLTFAILYRVVAERGVLAATAVLALTLLAAHERFMVRPEIFSFVLFGLYLAVLEGDAANDRRVWLLVALQAVWVNVHALFAVGLVVLWSYVAGGSLRQMLRAGPAAAVRDPRVRRWWMVGIAAVLACLLNPYGVQGASFPFTLLTRLTSEKAVYASIGELASPFTGQATPSVRAYEVLIAMSALSLLIDWRALRLDRLLAWVAFLALSASARRNMGFFALACVPIVADGLAVLGQWLATRRAAQRYLLPLRVAASTALTLALAVLIFLVTTNRFYWSFESRREFGLGVSAIDFPAGAVDFMGRNGVAGPLFNDLALGGYVAWRAQPPLKTFIDGRLEVYEEQFFAAYREALEQPAAFDALATKYDFNCVLLFHVWPNRRTLIYHLLTSNDWALIYLDEADVLFVRTRRENAAAARAGSVVIRQQVTGSGRAAGKDAPVQDLWRRLVWPLHAPHAHFQKGNLFINLQQPAAAIREFEATLRERPDFLAARVGLGYARWDGGQHDAARAEWRRALAVDPDFAPALEALQLAASRGD